MGRVHRVSVIVTFFGLCTSNVFGQSDQCTTPDNKLGDCKNIKECPPLLSILTHRPLDRNQVDFLRRSQCGFEGITPKVCCPLGGSSEAEPPVQTPSPLTPVTSNLLPDKTVCGISSESKIYGGEATDLDEFPWMALIEYQLPDGSRGFYCGGVLISKRYVLTAAHCLKGKALPRSWKLVAVRLGEYDTDTERDCITNGPGGGQECADPVVNVPVEERIAHEAYDPQDINQYNDIALLRLTREVKFTDYIKPICLPTTTTEQRVNFVGERLFVAGWGKTENKSESNVKLKVQVPVKSRTECAPTYRGVGVKIADTQICAGGESGKDSCRGDSGGPLMTVNTSRDNNWYAAGIVSFGPTPCGFENWPGIYTRVSSYVNWIVGKMKE